MISTKLQPDLRQLILRLQGEGAVMLLESQSANHPAARKSYLAARPQEAIWSYGDTVFIWDEDGITKHSDCNPWEELKKLYTETDGWLFGYLGYDLKNHIENLHSQNTDPVGAPDLYMMNPGLLIEMTPAGWFILKGEISNKFTNNDSTEHFSISGLQPQISQQHYCQIIRQARQQIGEGDYYEINLSHQMQGSFSGSPFQLYEGMKQAGPVPFGAYLSFGNDEDRWSVCCSSPERFLAKEGDRVYSQPIKGTIHRGNTDGEDRELKQWLEKSEKNRAENLMIVDLVRNDLGRIAQKGSVQVPELFQIQSFGTVHQMVSTIEAKAGKHHPVDIVRACFPMGSMTGAPKISAMRSIEALENYRRGIYSGAIGYLTPAGDFDFNVVIRTAIINDNRVYYATGGAITSDSDPQGEWQETLIKARALTAALADARRVADQVERK